jgi:hypothetical protein
MISAATPTATATEHAHARVSQPVEDPSKVLMELSSAEMELFKADMEASKAEAAVGKAEGVLARVWIITAITLLSLGVISVLIVSLKGKFGL